MKGKQAERYAIWQVLKAREQSNLWQQVADTPEHVLYLKALMLAEKPPKIGARARAALDADWASCMAEPTEEFLDNMSWRAVESPLRYYTLKIQRERDARLKREARRTDAPFQEPPSWDQGRFTSWSSSSVNQQDYTLRA